MQQKRTRRLREQRGGNANNHKVTKNTDEDLNKLDSKGLAPLHQLTYSPESEDVLIEKAKILLEKGANLELVGGGDVATPVMFAIANRKHKLATFFLDAGANPNVQNKVGSTLLQYAAQAGMLDLVQRFLALGQDIRYANELGFTALHYAAQQIHISVVEYLISQGADVNAKTKDIYKQTPLFMCIWVVLRNNDIIEKSKKCAEILLKNGAISNEELSIVSANLPLHSFIPLLLKYNADPNSIESLDGNDYNPLQKVIAIKGTLETVKALIEAGVNIDHVSKDNYTALTLSLLKEHRNKDIARYLLEHGANPNKAVTNKTEYALYYVHKLKQPLIFYIFTDTELLDLLPLFLEKGQNPNVLGQMTSTLSTRPLHYAINVYNQTSNKDLQKTLLESIKLLISAGADMKLKDSNGQTAEDLAQDEETEKALGIIKLWEGFTRSDVAFLNSIFTKETRGNIPKANDYSLCPVCLKTIERPEGCMHMQHNCKEQSGFYHKKLYEKYKSQDKIHWCTICNRIGFGSGTHFEHYALGTAKGRIPKKAGPSQVFDNDCRTRSGGGGLPEKYQRFNTLRNVALQFNHPSLINSQISQREVMEKLVEAMWNAPLIKNPLAEIQFMEEKWNKPNTNFPLPKISTYLDDANIPTPNSVQDPIIHPMETDQWQNATMISETDIIQFLHPSNSHDKPGQQISRQAFSGWLSNLLGNPLSERFGHCWLYMTKEEQAAATAAEIVNHCGSILWPREVRVALGLHESPEDDENAEYRKLYEGYRKQFSRISRNVLNNA